MLHTKHFGMRTKDFFKLCYRFREKNLQDILESSLNLDDGLTALIKFYARLFGEPWYRFEDIWIEVGNKFFMLSC